VPQRASKKRSAAMLEVTDETFAADVEGHRGLALVDFTGEG
jgi:hypothetical protein